MKRWNAAATQRIYAAADLGITPASNWTISYCAAYVTGRLRTLQLALTYGGTTITSSSAGNIGDQNVLASTLPADWCPPSNSVFSFNNSGTSDGAGLVTTAGQVTLTSLSPTATIASGSSIVLTASYIA